MFGISILLVAAICLPFTYIVFTQKQTCMSRVCTVLLRQWNHLIKSNISLSLSTREQSIFEEEFKYLIVTSSLFNETPQLEQSSGHHVSAESIMSVMKAKPPQKEFTLNDLTATIIVTSIAFIVFSIGIKSSAALLFFCLIPFYLSICYFQYRRYRHIQIRKIHTSALESMHEIISLSKESDAMLMSLLKAFHANEYQDQQQSFGTMLSSHFEMYTETVMQLQPLVDAYNLSRLRDMYSVSKEIPSVLLEFDSHQFGLEDIDLIYSVIVWKRREYLLHLLALDVMSNNKTTRYGQNWRQAIHANKTLVNSYNSFNKKLFDLSVHVDTYQNAQKQRPISISSISTVSDDASVMAEGTPDEKTLTLMHRVSTLEKYIEDIQAKLFLCKQDARSLATNRVSIFSLERMNKRFSSMEDTITNLNNQWEESKLSLNVLLEHEQIKLKSSLSSLPSPPVSPTAKEYTDIKSEGKSKSPTSKTLSRSHSLNSINRRHSLNQNRLSRIQSLKLKGNNHRKSVLLPSNICIEETNLS